MLLNACILNVNFMALFIANYMHINTGAQISTLARTRNCKRVHKLNEKCALWSPVSRWQNKGGGICCSVCLLENLSKPVPQEQYRPVIHHNRPEQINKLEKIAPHKRLARTYLSKLQEACVWPIRTPSFCKGEYLIDASWHHRHIPSRKL